MAGLSVFSYRHKDSVYHRLDPRCKLIVLLYMNLITFTGGFTVLAVLSICILILIKQLGLSLLSLLSQTQVFILLLLFIFISRALFIEGGPWINLKVFSVSREGVLSGLMYCWRLSIVLYAGVIFISTTLTSHIRASIEWFLKPIPLVPEKRIGIMISLMIRFFPVILSLAESVRDAQKSRGIENRKNPVYRITSFSLPFLRRIFLNADQLAIAMEARCFSEQRTEADLQIRPVDIIWLLTGFGLLSSLMLLQNMLFS